MRLIYFNRTSDDKKIAGANESHTESPSLEKHTTELGIHYLDGDKTNHDPLNIVIGCADCVRECGEQNAFEFMHRKGRPLFPMVYEKLIQYNERNGIKKYQDIYHFAFYHLDIKRGTMLAQLRGEVNAAMGAKK